MLTQVIDAEIWHCVFLNVKIAKVGKPVGGFMTVDALDKDLKISKEFRNPKSKNLLEIVFTVTS